MRATLEFDLDCPKDRSEHKHTLRALDYLAVLQDLDALLRSKVKYGEDHNQVGTHTVQEIRTNLHNLCTERGFDLWEE